MLLSRFGVAALALASVSAFTAPAHAQLSVSLSQPSQSYDTSSGQQLLVFYGTVQNNTLDTQSISEYGVRYPYDAAGQPLSNSDNNVFGFPSMLPSQFAPGSSFTGALFDAQLDATTLPGVYDLAIGAGSTPDIPAYFEIQETDTKTATFYDSKADFSITVTSPAAVPESSTTISFGLLLALGLGSVAVAARKKAVA